MMFFLKLFKKQLILLREICFRYNKVKRFPSIAQLFSRTEFPNANLLFTSFERSELESLETDSRFHPLSDSNVGRIAAIGKPRK